MIRKMVVSGIEEIAWSRARLKIASLISIRPRSLGELSDAVGISIQGILKHLRILEGLGLISEIRISRPASIRIRKLYALGPWKVVDYSENEFIIANLQHGGPRGPTVASHEDPYTGLEKQSEEILFVERRVRELARRARMVMEELGENQDRLLDLVAATGLSPEEKIIATVVFTEDTLAEARDILSLHYGCKNPDETIARVLEKLRREKRAES